MIPHKKFREAAMETPRAMETDLALDVPSAMAMETAWAEMVTSGSEMGTLVGVRTPVILELAEGPSENLSFDVRKITGTRSQTTVRSSSPVRTAGITSTVTLGTGRPTVGAIPLGFPCKFNQLAL